MIFLMTFEFIFISHRFYLAKDTFMKTHHQPVCPSYSRCWPALSMALRLLWRRSTALSYPKFCCPFTKDVIYACIMSTWVSVSWSLCSLIRLYSPVYWTVRTCAERWWRSRGEKAVCPRFIYIYIYNSQTHLSLIRLTGLLRIWPERACTKSVLFLSELEEIICSSNTESIESCAMVHIYRSLHTARTYRCIQWRVILSNYDYHTHPSHLCYRILCVNRLSCGV